MSIVAVFSFSLKTLHGSPWASPGDSQLRADVELLAHHGLISGPVNSWPISWKQITREFYKSDTMKLPNYVERALNRVIAKIPAEFNGKTKVSYTNKVQFFRGFEDEPRAELEIEGAAEINLENTSLHIEGRYFDTHDYNLDNTYISQDLGNWSFYGGSVERWWGPGQETTTILSTNARPMPSIGIRRVTSKPFKTKWLSWMGSWDAELFVSQMDKNRFIPKPIFVGMRFNFKPVNNFEVGLARTLMLCGEGRACGLQQWTHSLIAIGDLDNFGDSPEDVSNQPGNQLAQLTLSYTHSISKNINLKVYLEGTAEDLVLMIPYTYSRLFGVTLDGAFGNDGSRWQITTEASDTTGSLAWFYGEHRKGVLYNHFIYRSGYRYKNRVIGHSLDSNSSYISAKASLIRSNGMEFSLKYQNILINSEGDTNNLLSNDRERINSFTAEIAASTGIGLIRAKGAILDNEIKTPLNDDIAFMFTTSWSINF